MLPTQVNYPEFIPDQLLTSEHLNQLFGYLEEQGRLTRTNLIGIGIVCGLEVKTNAAGTEITITKGCGVTSEGYLVSVPEVTYSSSKPFNAVQERIYDRFVDGSKNQRFDEIYELKQAAVEEGTTVLNSDFLVNKVVLIFVEILEEGAKNCNPNSCDDKGINVTVSLRPLLLNKKDVDSLGEGNAIPQAMLALPDLKLRRYDVTSTNLKDSAAVFKAFGVILNPAFLNRIESAFNQAYETFLPLLPDLYVGNPFAGLAAKFKFLNDGTIDSQQLLNLQYYYDLFSDLLLAYTELQKTGTELLSSCCPDSNLFPRHLLLGLTQPDTTKLKSDYRHYFIPSPIIQGNALLVKELRSLFKRLVLLIENFFTPIPLTGGNATEKKASIDTNIRITPSKLGDIPLSEKSIPFYYKVAEGTDWLFQYWDYNKTIKDRADQNLSYRADEYNGGDEHIRTPLLYDLEPHNFLRIEGHLGKQYTAALRNILRIKEQHRLPFEVIALSTDVASLKRQVRDLSRKSSASGLAEKYGEKDSPQCQFQDLESLYDTITAELTCSLCKEMKYFYDQKGMGNLPEPASKVPQVSLLRKCDPSFQFTANSFGHAFEIYYSRIKNQPYVAADVFMAATAHSPLAGTTKSYDQSKNIALELLYYIQKLSETIAEDLSEFDLNEFNTRYADLLKTASQIKDIMSSKSLEGPASAVLEDIIDHLDALIFVCKQAQFQTLHKDYMSRWVYIIMLQNLGYFLKIHPGIQHKAGVTVGGTFILVYHEGEADVDEDSFLMTIEDVFSIAGRGTVVTGQIERGEIHSGDTITISGMGVEEKQTTVGGLEASRKTIERAKAGDSIGILLKGIQKDDVMPGMIITNAGSQATHIDMVTETSEGILIKKKGMRYIDDILHPSYRYKDSGNSLSSLVNEISNGTVIADFYLPYLCYSDCPPVHYILPNEKQKPAERINISIDPKEYCLSDKSSITITASPEGGQVTGESVKVVNGVARFMPSGVDLGDTIQKIVTLTYTKDGQSITTDVVVYQKPTVGFTVVQEGTSNPVSFTNQSEFAGSFKWEFGDGAISDEKEPSHTYESEGSYSVTLTVFNGVCENKLTYDKQIIIKETPVQNCQPLAEIYQTYLKLTDNLNSDVMTIFYSKFPLYRKEVEGFFKRLTEIVPLPTTAHIKFFKENETLKSLSQWLSALFELKEEPEIVRPVFRMYSVLTQLTLYIQCIQKEDMGKTELDITPLKNILNRQMKELSTLNQRNPEVYNEPVERLVEVLKGEQERINKEKKPTYFKQMDGLVKKLIIK